MPLSIYANIVGTDGRQNNMEYIAILALGLMDWYAHCGYFYISHLRGSKISQIF